MDNVSEISSIPTAVSTMLEHATEPLYLVRSSAELIEIFVETATNHESPPLHVLAAETELKAVRNHFPSASQAADLVENDRLALTPVVPEGWGTTVVTAETAYAFAHVDGQELVMETTDVPTGVRDTCAGCRDAHERFPLRTPPWSAVTASLTETFNSEVSADFSTAMEVLDDLEMSTVDEIDSALLVGAGHELLLYDLSQCGEDIRLGSRATFSRAKGDLEDAEIFTSEKVPSEVGRPRQRLLLTDEYASLTIPELLREVDAVKSD